METKDFYNYIVYEDGRVYSTLSHKFLRGDITKQGYIQYFLIINGKAMRIKAHQLVAKLWLQKPIDSKKLIINHKDGNKLNNRPSNLEWCSYYENNKHARETGLNNVSLSNHIRWKSPQFRERTSKHISEGIKSAGVSKGERNPRFRYRILIDGKLISRQELACYLNLSQSYTDACIRKSSQGKPIPIFIQNKIEIIDIKQQGPSTIKI